MFAKPKFATTKQNTEKKNYKEFITYLRDNRMEDTLHMQSVAL